MNTLLENLLKSWQGCNINAKLQRMYVLSNLATSIDGKIGTADRSHFYLGTEEDRRNMQVLRKEVEAIIMGATTIRGFKRPCLAKDAEKHPANVIVSRSLEGLDPEWPFFKSDKIKRILFYSGHPSQQQMNALTPSSELVKIDDSKPLAPQILKKLTDHGFKKVIVEGGGGVMWDFASQNLIDEYHLTLTPKVVGGDKAPTLVDGAGFKPEGVLSLKLHECRQVGDELFLVYRKK